MVTYSSKTPVKILMKLAIIPLVFILNSALVFPNSNYTIQERLQIQHPLDSLEPAMNSYERKDLKVMNKVILKMLHFTIPRY